MRSRGLSFADAVKLLDGDSELVERLGSLAGLATGTVTVASAGTVDFFALRDQIVRWGQSAVRAWRDKVQGLGRFDRTERLIAAHTVIVVVSLLEAVEASLAARGHRLEAARLTPAERAMIAAGKPIGSNYSALVNEMVSKYAPYPTPANPTELVEVRLDAFFQGRATMIMMFLNGLSAFERADLTAIVPDICKDALRRYRAAYRRLAGEIPEFRMWTQTIDAQATRELIRETSAARHAAVDAVRAGLARLYEARLAKPILSTTNAPGELVLPSLRDGYQEPAGQLASAGPNSLPATEEWWGLNGRSVPAVQEFLIAMLTAGSATDQPIVILGQPGSGKSILTRVLAARLAGADFLPVRVELRNVRADAPVQHQIEEALYRHLGEKVTWPDLVRRAGTALPVVMMDGFDELLQATGQNWAGYLEQLQDFQQREAVLGRPLAILVTSRTVVADRARFPEDTAVVRLDPFDDDRVAAWLHVWNGLNEPGLAARELRPLPPGVAMEHRELACQPLLLLLLAIYDGRANELQRAEGGLGRVELYERLFTDFFERQVDKFGSELGPEQWDAEVAAEWRRLCAVAVAMHNRGRDVILEAELEEDARLLLTAEDRTLPTAANRPLSIGQLLVGRFFFVHESRASRDTGDVERSFEFLHATFAEFLAARQIVMALVELAEDRALLRRRPLATLDAGYLYALTSFTTITRRQPLWEFCQAMIARLDPEVRRSSRELVLELLPQAGRPQPTWSLREYEPEPRTAAERQAAFSANLMCLAVLLTDGPVDVAELVDSPVVVNWRRQALLWMGQLEPEDARRLWQAMRVEWSGTVPPRLWIRVEDHSEIAVDTSLPWPPDQATIHHPRLIRGLAMEAQSATGRMLRKSAFAQTGIDARELFYVLIPFWRRFGDIGFKPDAMWRSDARSLLELLLGEPAFYEDSVDDIIADRGRAEIYLDLLAGAQAALSEGLRMLPPRS
ncbi:NACHT domain-containing protein [Actinoplanes sp. NPDC051513]|uniref:NACHT domain-containing protein n=1 Tax=Actinoplanes sp. NPDC051513 TaxID=3363908 RepID=UPI00378B1536